MVNNEKFGKVTYDNLPQAVEYLIKLIEMQVEKQNKDVSIEEDEMTIKEVSALIRKSISTIYRYTSQQSIPHTKLCNSLRFSRSEILAWMGIHKNTSMQDLSDEVTMESFKILNRS